MPRSRTGCGRWRPRWLSLSRRSWAALHLLQQRHRLFDLLLRQTPTSRSSKPYRPEPLLSPLPAHLLLIQLLDHVSIHLYPNVALVPVTFYLPNKRRTILIVHGAFMFATRSTVIPYRAPPAPPPRPAFVPHVLQRQGPGSRMVPPRPSPPGPPPPPAPPQHVMLPPAHFPPPQVLPMLPISHNSTPKMNPSIIQAPPTVYFAHTLRTQEEVTTAGHTAAHSAGLGDDNLVPVTTAPEESSTVIGPQLPERGGETDGGEGALGTGKKGKVKTAKGNKKGGEKKGKKGSDKPKKSLRTASGITWEDQSLLEWDASGL
uniref:Uncharacterized protein n=1 Tax=Eptatretus burgeri TaxID=7764 RepID=A0A8C4QT55_EPTBU